VNAFLLSYAQSLDRGLYFSNPKAGHEQEHFELLAGEARLRIHPRHDAPIWLAIRPNQWRCALLHGLGDLAWDQLLLEKR